MTRRVRFYGLFFPESILHTAIYLVNLFTQKYVFFNRKFRILLSVEKGNPISSYFPLFLHGSSSNNKTTGAERFSRTLAD
jgi:hypothetical protein